MTQHPQWGPGQWQGFTPPPPPPAPPKRGVPTSVKVIGWGIAGIVAIGVIANLGGGSGTPTSRTVATESAPRPTTPAPTTPARPVGPQTSFGDGTWIVGADIEPGTYRSTGAQEGVFEFCSYSRLRDASSDGDTLSWGTANANEPIVIAIKASDGAFKSAGCATFTKVK